MESVPHPLDWWAYGDYPEVIRRTGWSPPRARREVRKAIKSLGLHPLGHRGYLELRRRIMAGELFSNDLM
jgi:hypothetical protein